MTYPASPVTPSEPQAVVIYCRLSLDRDQTGLAVQRQEAECREYATERGWTVTKVYTDNDISATSGKRRPGFEALLADRPPAVLVWNLDRLVRVSRDLERVLDLQALVYAVQAGSLPFDLSSALGQMQARMVTVFSTYEGQVRSERQRSAYRQRAQLGGRGWSNRPFGYELDGTLREGEAALVRKGYADALAGVATATIASDWNASGLAEGRDLGREERRDGEARARGKAFTGHTVRQTLLNARNAGLKVHHGEVVGLGDWTPIVDEPTWRGAVAVLTSPSRKRNTHGGSKVLTLLTNIATCGVCGQHLKRIRTDMLLNATGTKRFPVAKYGCKAGHLAIAEDWLNAHAMLELQEALPAHMDAWTGPGDEDTASRALELRAELARISQQVDEVAAQMGNDDLPMEFALTAARKLQERRTAAQEELDGLTASASAAEWIHDLEMFWEATDEMDLDRMRAMVAAVFTSISVMPSGKGRYSKPKREQITFTTRNPIPPKPKRKPLPQRPAVSLTDGSIAR